MGVSTAMVAGPAADTTQDAPITRTTSERLVMRDSMPQARSPWSVVRGPWSVVRRPAEPVEAAG